MIYLDNFATTKVYDEVAQKIIEIMTKNYGNASSIHKFGYESERIIVEQKKKIQKIIDAKEDEIYFTSGGTESNNLAIFGVCDAYKRRGNKVITTKIEHPSVKNCFKKLEEIGFDVHYLDVDKKGYINIDELINIVDKETILVSIMYVNNEIGTIQKIDEIGEKIKEKNKQTIFHTDAVQGFAKLKINTKYIDLLSASGHKIHAQKGIGMLYVKKGIRLNSILHGAGQQNGLRSGTISTEGIVGFCMGAELTYQNYEKNYEKMTQIKNEILKLKDDIENICINGDEKYGIPYVISISFKDIFAETIVHALEKHNIFVSTGSACSSKGKNIETAMDYINKENKRSTIRVSLSSYNTLYDALQFNTVIKEIIPKLKIYTQK